MGVKTGVILLLACLLAPATARAACTVDNKATVALDVAGGAITVPVEVNGTVATLIVDTGAQRSLVTEDAVHRLGLARDEWVGTTMRGIGGIESRPNADPRSLTLGGVPLVRRTVTHDTSLTVGILPRTHIGNLVIDGVLGRDFLAPFDLDLDVPNRRLTLYQVQDCTGRFLPWQGGYTAVPVTLPAENALIVPVTLDGMPLRALLDTGAGASMLAAPGLFRLGVQPASLAGDPSSTVSGAGSHMVTMHRHTFRSLKVGGEATDAPVIWTAPIQLMPIVDMLLGADWLATRHIWISFATKQLFVATQ
jgi:predicted aspartyl protease